VVGTAGVGKEMAENPFLLVYFASIGLNGVPVFNASREKSGMDA
jgi:hypothetical protein